MKKKRTLICAFCGFVACAHLAGLTFVESAHPRLPGMLLPHAFTDHEHEHREHSRSARLPAMRMAVSAATTSASAVITPQTGELRFGR